MLAQTLGVEEIAITDDEGKAFLGAAKNVMRHYNVQTTQKTMDWIALVGVAATIYAPRIAAIGMRKRSERAPTRPATTEETQSNVYHFAGGIHTTNPDDFIGGAAE